MEISLIEMYRNFYKLLIIGN